MKIRSTIVIGLAIASGVIFWCVSTKKMKQVAVVKPIATTPVSVAKSNVKPVPAIQIRTAEIRPIFGLSGESFPVRLQSINGLGTNLCRADIEMLYKFLRTSGSRSGTLIGGEHVLKNQVMELLLLQVPLPEDLARNFSALYRDSSQDEVTRDYALQHLFSLTLAKNRLTGGTNGSPESIRALWEAVNETSGSFAGTALLGLHRTSGVDSNRVDETALHLVQDATMSNLSRSTALQVCAQRGISQALPEALALAEQAPTLALQISAVAAVGSLGGTPEEAFLERLKKEGSPHLQSAVESALRRLRNRQNLAHNTISEK